VSLLDSILDRLMDGGEVRVIVVGEPEPPCGWPTYSPETSYNKGCRCPRCRIHHNTRAAELGREARRRRAAQRSTMRRIQWGHR
jgi:hypothetical protein